MNLIYVWVGLIVAAWFGFFILSLYFLKKKFIPASDYLSAVKIAQKLQSEGFTPIINLLGEHYASREKVEQTFRQYLYLVDALFEAGINGKISAKPTQLGLAISKEIYCNCVWRLARRARNQNIFLEIDMEGAKYLADTLEVFWKIPGSYDVRQAVQAYLKRSQKDIEEFIKRRRKVRLVKGAYAEGDLGRPETQAQIKNFTEKFLIHGLKPAIATVKDEKLMDDIFKLTEERGILKNRFIIQTLYGIGDDLKRKWRDEGFRVEVYVPVGPWRKALPFVWRRIKEIFKNIKTPINHKH